MEKIKGSLPIQIFIALGLGIVAGLIFLALGLADFTVAYIKPFGTIFLNLLKFIVVPIVITSIVQGVVSLSDIKKVGTIGLRTIIYYFCTTAFAITIGLIFANLFKGSYKVLQTTDLAYEAAEPTSLMDTIVNIFPSNLFQPMVDSTMLQIIVIALFIGFGIIISGEKGKLFSDWIDSVYEVFMVVMRGIIKVTPIAVFCLITPVVAVNGPEVLGSLAMVLLTAYIAYAVHMFFTYSLAVKAFGHMSPAKFLKGALPGFLFAFSSTSSIGTLPVSMECVEKMGGRKDVASFTLPLGATINMDGTAIYQGVCAIFIASCFGINLTFGQMITIVLTATLASIGTAGTPGAGMIMLAMVLQSVGLPVEGIALVAGVDRIFDMGRTGVNVVGDMSAAMIITDYENRREAKEAAKANA
jgi:Na+/H+-dicarboxylate symporter